MSDQPPSLPGHDVSESLWAISDEGIIWQINPLSRNAAPVVHWDELPARARRSLQYHALRGWTRRDCGDAIPGDLAMYFRTLPASVL